MKLLHSTVHGSGLPLCSLLLTTLSLCARSTKSEAQPQGTIAPKAATASTPSMKDTLLAVAQTVATLRECPFLPLFSIRKNGTSVSRTDYTSSEKYQTWIQQGYFTRRTVSPSQFKLLPTRRYLDILSHARSSDSPTRRICLGTARLSALTNLRQLDPDKFTANAPLPPTLTAWVTPEIMQLFGPYRNCPAYVPATLIFLRSGDT